MVLAFLVRTHLPLVGEHTEGNPFLSGVGAYSAIFGQLCVTALHRILAQRLCSLSERSAGPEAHDRNCSKHTGYSKPVCKAGLYLAVDRWVPV